MIQKIIAKNIKDLRREKNLTQAELAEAIDVSLTTIQSIENARSWPELETVKALSNFFGVEDHELFTYRFNPITSKIEKIVSTYSKQTKLFQSQLDKELISLIKKKKQT